jgi:hypothetical protein
MLVAFAKVSYYIESNEAVNVVAVEESVTFDGGEGADIDVVVL